MATNHTTNYALNLWEPQDDFLREEFNENTQKIDAAVGALSQTVAAKGNCTIVTGTYIGTGEYGAEQPNVLDFAPLKPLFLFVADDDSYGHHMIVCRGGRYATTKADGNNASICAVTWTDTGVSWYSPNQNGASVVHQLNISGKNYYYIALC